MLIPSEFDLGEVDVFEQSVLLLENGTQSFIAHSGYESGAFAQLQVTELYSNYGTRLNRSHAPKDGRYGFMDFFNIGASSLIYSGINNASKHLFLDTGNGFSQQREIPELNDFSNPSILTFDYSNDGLVDTLVAGSQSSSATTTLLRNNGSNLTSVSTSLPDLQFASICYGDFNNDSRYDLFVSGENASDIDSSIYLHNGSDYSLNRSLPSQFYRGTCALGRFLSPDRTSLLHFGTNSIAGAENPSNWGYVIYNDTSNWSQTTIGLLPDFNGSIYGDVVIADFSGDGISDIFLCGGTSGNEILLLYVNDLNESGEFIKVNPFEQDYTLPECSLSAADYDFDGDLDLAYTGVGSGQPIMLFNNTASSVALNSAPQPPPNISGKWNTSTGELSINWSHASDTETPSSALSYNLEIRSTNGDILLSGQPSITSKPAQGYLGNMQFRQSYTLYNRTPQNVIIRIQSIDAGLQRSTWTEATILIEACETKQIWNISTPFGCSLPSAILNNSIIRIQNGSTLTVDQLSDLGQNSGIIVENGSLTITAPITGENATIRVTPDGNISSRDLNLSGINLTLERPLNLVDSVFEHLQSNASLQLINSTWRTLSTTAVVDVRYYLDLNFSNQFGAPVENVSIFNNSEFISNSARINLTSIWINTTENQSRIHNLTYSRIGHYNSTASFQLTNNSLAQITLNRDPTPQIEGFNVSNLPTANGDNYTADLSKFTDIENITINRTSVGSIQFLERVNISFINISEAVSIQPRSIFINDTSASGLNRSARLRFHNLNFIQSPVILRNGAVCDSCSNQSYINRSFTTDVLGFSNYSLVNNSEVSLITPSVLFNATSSAFAVSYYDYQNTSKVITGASCSATIGSNTTLLAFNGNNHSNSLYFNSTGAFVANVSCSGNSSYEPLNQTYTLNVVRNGAYFLKDSDYTGLAFSTSVFGNLSNLNRFWSTGTISLITSNTEEVSIPSEFHLNESSYLGDVVLADLNNDGWDDLFLMGAGSSLSWWDNLTTKHVLNLSLENGDAEVFDYDFDGDLDIIACGLNESDLPQTVLLQNQLSDQDYQNGANFLALPSPLPDLRDCNLKSARVSNSHGLIVAGKNTSDDDVVESYNVTQDDFSLIQKFSPWFSPHVQIHMADFTEDGKIDLILSGELNSKKNTSFFTGNESGFSHSLVLSNQLENYSKLKSSITSARLTNQTNQSFIISGITDNGYDILAYGYNGTHFVEQDIALDIEPTYYGSLTLGDIDADSDLDLLITGQSQDGAITQLYTNTLAQFEGVDTKPTAPSILSADYSDGTLSINWSNGTDVETPNTLLSYSLRVGSIQHPNQFHSGTHSQEGNQGHRHSALLSLPDACVGIQVRTIDLSYQPGNWTQLTYANNHSEVCNGYDNDCDGLSDEDFLYPGTDLFIYNGSLNSTPFTCSFYETYAPENLSCPNAPTHSPGIPCRTNTHYGAVYAWNLSSKTCDCDTSGATLKNVQIDSKRGSGGGSFSPAQQEQEEVEPEQLPEEVARPPPESDKSSSTSLSTKNYFTTTLADFEIRSEVTYRNGNTYVSNSIRNTQRTLKRNIVFNVEFPADLEPSLQHLRSLNEFKRDKTTVEFEIENLDYLEEAALLYSLSGIHSIDSLKSAELSLQSHNDYDREQLAVIEAAKSAQAEKSIITNLSETVVNNRTVIRLDIDLKENVTEVHGIEIEQEIPKCLIEEITDSILESAIAPALLDHVEIKEADPLLVWRFDRLEDAVNLELSLDALRSADCEDEVSLELLAKSFIYQNQPINKFSVFLVLFLSLALVAITLSPALLAATHRFHKHENPHILRLAKIIVRQKHKGVSEADITSHLRDNDESDTDIATAFEHVNSHEPSHTGLTFFEHRVEISLFFAVLILSVLELSGALPGSLDWFKKVLSWAIMLLVVHHANLARLFFNEDAPKFSITLMIGMFLMHLVHLAEFAVEGLSHSVGFVFDLYVAIVRLDDTAHLSWILFCTGLSILVGCAIYAAIKLPIRERSLCSVFFTDASVKGWRVALRAVALTGIFAVFFFSIFNRLIEWLAIAVDSVLFVLAVITLLALTLSMVAHHRGHRIRHFWESIFETLSDYYLIGFGLALGLLAIMRPFFPPWLVTGSLLAIGVSILLTFVFILARLRQFHEMSELEHIPLALDHLYEKFIRLLRYPRTFILALSGLVTLQLVVETALTIIPNITGQASHVYGAGHGTLFSLIGNTGLISQQLFFMPANEAIAYAALYLMSFLGLIVLLLTPVWVWALAFRNRGHGFASGSVITWLHGHSNWTKRIGHILLVAGLPLGLFYWKYPVLLIEPLILEGTAGVQFIPQLLDIPLAHGWGSLAILLLSISLIALSMRWRRTAIIATYASIYGTLTLIGLLYFVPFIHSLLSEALTLLQNTHGWPLNVLAIVLGTLHSVDLVLIYAIGGLCFAFLALPLALKKWIVQRISHFPVFHRILELASNRHLLEYYDEARVRFAGNVKHHVQHYMRQCDSAGVSKSEQIRILRAHGYPKKVTT